ncbi:hypothetical protein MFFC18_22540 [Mariniblastus fucicola]|uniref:Uncharacterized protein n=1 Tax=Mariniblastus fucicola TaxID=980251 RepID=A0A5B9P7Q9_9BACT|nr:hypothetical protein MFFC18_22540 [Mariniblastus fucicola]
MIAALLWCRVVTVADGDVSLGYTSQPDATDPYGPDVSTHIFYISTVGALTLMGVAVALSLAVVNGVIVYWRRMAFA